MSVPNLERLRSQDCGRNNFRDFAQNLPYFIPEVKSVEVIDNQGFPDGWLVYKAKVESKGHHTFLLEYTPGKQIHTIPGYEFWQEGTDAFRISQPLRNLNPEGRPSIENVSNLPMEKIGRMSNWWIERSSQLVEDGVLNYIDSFEITIDPHEGFLVFGYWDKLGYTVEGMVETVKEFIQVMPEVAVKCDEIFGPVS